MKVIVKQQSSNHKPVEIVWSGGAVPSDDLGVMLSVAQLLQHAKDESPWAPRVLEIRIELSKECGNE